MDVATTQVVFRSMAEVRREIREQNKRGWLVGDERVVLTESELDQARSLGEERPRERRFRDLR